MLLHQLVSPDVPIASPTDTVDYISSLFFASQLQQIPVIDQSHYLGLIEAKDLNQLQQEPEELKLRLYEQFRPAISVNAHPFEALRVLHQFELSILPVINDDHEYAGSLTKDGLLKYLIEQINIDVNGGIVVLEMEPRNYSLAQIARICENEQVLILGAQAKTNPLTSKLELTIKTNSTDLSAVVQAFERYEYTVVDTYGDQKIENDTSDRYKLLMNYINM
jgi:predicted transcriptional regulator